MGKVLKAIFILSLSIFFIQSSVANEIDQAKLKKMFESCADNSFKNFYEKKYHEYLKKSFILKIKNSTPYEMLFEDCEFEHKKYPIYGVQFHPESIVTDHGMRMVQNFLEV